MGNITQLNEGIPTRLRVTLHGRGSLDARPAPASLAERAVRCARKPGELAGLVGSGGRRGTCHGGRARPNSNKSCGVACRLLRRPGPQVAPSTDVPSVTSGIGTLAEVVLWTSFWGDVEPEVSSHEPYEPTRSQVTARSDLPDVSRDTYHRSGAPRGHTGRGRMRCRDPLHAWLAPSSEARGPGMKRARVSLPLRRLPSRFRPRQILLAVLLLATTGASRADATVTGTVHDLSTNWDEYSDQVCVFCHTPHFANTTRANWPLWNRFVDLSKVYNVYSSATLNTSPEQPSTGSSVLCLGCHDGTIGTAVVNGYLGSDKHDLVNAPGPGGMPDMTSWPECRRCHGEMYGDPPAVWLGTDLGDDHPIAVHYPTPALDPEFQTPPDPNRGWSQVPLFAGRIECSTCHDVHDATYQPFLRISNVGSALCLTCHVK